MDSQHLLDSFVAGGWTVVYVSAQSKLQELLASQDRYTVIVHNIGVNDEDVYLLGNNEIDTVKLRIRCGVILRRDFPDRRLGRYRQ